MSGIAGEIIDFPNRPSEIELQLTQKCNLSCIHCFSHGDPSNYGDISKNAGINLIERIANIGIPYISFTGGEPLLVNDLETYINKAHSLGLEVAIQTNGLLANQDIIESLVANGLSGVGVSLDGLQGSHEMIRGPGTYHQTLDSIKIMTKFSSLRVSVNMLIHDSNVEEVPDVANILRQLGVDYMICIPRQLFGRAIENKDLIPLSTDTLMSLYLNRRIWAEAANFPIRVNGPLACLVGESQAGPCNAGRTRLGILTNGECHPCVPIPYSIGNVFKQTIQDIWINSIFLNELRRTDLLSNECKSCFYKLSCHGGCRIAALFEDGSHLHKDPYCFKNIMKAHANYNSIDAMLHSLSMETVYRKPSYLIDKFDCEKKSMKIQTGHANYELGLREQIIWESIDGKRTLYDILNLVTKKLSTNSETALIEICRFLLEMEHQKLIFRIITKIKE